MQIEEFWSLCKEHDVGSAVIRATIFLDPNESRYMLDIEFLGFEFFFQGKYLERILDNSSEIIRLLAREGRKKIYEFMCLISECDYKAELTLDWVKDDIAYWDLSVMHGIWQVCEKSGTSVVECCEFIGDYIRTEMAKAEEDTIEARKE